MALPTLEGLWERCKVWTFSKVVGGWALVTLALDGELHVKAKYTGVKRDKCPGVFANARCWMLSVVYDICCYVYILASFARNNDVTQVKKKQLMWHPTRCFLCKRAADVTNRVCVSCRYSEEMVPLHPCLALISNCEQTLSSHTSRRLIAMEKTREPEVCGGVFVWRFIDTVRVLNNHFPASLIILNYL